VKAKYLAVIGSFVEWPPDTFADAYEPFVIGVVGRYSFGISLADEIKGKKIHGRKVQIRAKKFGDNLRDCQIVFISDSEVARMEPILNSLRGTHVLAVGESEGFLEAGGALNFVMEDRRVRFDANLPAAARAKLRISAQLLMAARVVLNNLSPSEI
jgi:hypothetical protein